MSILSTAFRDIYNLSFQVSPIILKNGIANNVPGKMLPIIGLNSQLLGALQGLITNATVETLATGAASDANNFPVQYMPITGGTVINNSIGMYPFANRDVAANAVIRQPNAISLRMISPVNTKGGYLTKLAIFQSFVTALQAHNNSGGTYIIATPAFLYNDCVMTSMTNITGADSKQQQIEWQLDFVQPLITLQDAEIAYGAAMNNLANGSQVTTNAQTGVGVISSVNGALSSISGVAGSVINYLSASAL